MVLLVEVHCCKFQYFQCVGCLGDPSVVFVFISYLYTKIVAYGIQRRRIINQFFFALVVGVVGINIKIQTPLDFGR